MTITLPSADVIIPIGTPLYKGFRVDIKGPLRSLKHFYVANNKSVAQCPAIKYKLPLGVLYKTANNVNELTAIQIPFLKCSTNDNK